MYSNTLSEIIEVEGCLECHKTDRVQNRKLYKKERILISLINLIVQNGGTGVYKSRGMTITDSSLITITDNIISNFEIGIYIWDMSNSVISDNDLCNNQAAFEKNIRPDSDNTFSNNKCGTSPLEIITIVGVSIISVIVVIFVTKKIISYRKMKNFDLDKEIDKNSDSEDRKFEF